MATYEEVENRSYSINDEGERKLLCNFTARITQETRIVDGLQTETILTIEGWAHNADKPKQPNRLLPVEVAAKDYAGLGWVMNAWGVGAIIQPGHGVKEDIRALIQLNSRPERKTIYRSLGWTAIDGSPAYLHAGGAITSKGNDNTVSVRLPPELQRFDLTETERNQQKRAFLASLFLTTLGPRKVTWTLWTATFAPIFGECDFATHVTGRSGTFKSEVISLFQSHYGPKMDARHLPGSWSSTPNALEAQAYYAKNAVFSIDDFVPCGTAWQVRAYQTGADKLIRAQGNQAGRARLTDTSGMQTTYYPRGLIMSTGEDTPEGHSVRARMMINELSPGEIDVAKLTKAQAMRTYYSIATHDVILQQCRNQIDLTKRSHKVRDENIKVGHTRTPSMIGRLIATGETVINLGLGLGYIDQKQADGFIEEMRAGILEAGNDQSRYLENADPVQIFLQALRQVLGAGQAHIRTMHGGIPLNATTLGWTSEKSSGAAETYKSHGPCIGWISWDENEIFIDADNGYAAIKKVAGPELPLTKQTVWKRLKDAGMLLRTDDNRQRNTIRVTAEGHQRQVIAMVATDALDTQEVPGNIPK